MSCQCRRRRRLLCVRRWRLMYIFGDPRAGAQWAAVIKKWGSCAGGECEDVVAMAGLLWV